MKRSQITSSEDSDQDDSKAKSSDEIMKGENSIGDETSTDLDPDMNLDKLDIGSVGKYIRAFLSRQKYSEECIVDACGSVFRTRSTFFDFHGESKIWKDFLVDKGRPEAVIYDENYDPNNVSITVLLCHVESKNPFCSFRYGK